MRSGIEWGCGGSSGADQVAIRTFVVRISHSATSLMIAPFRTPVRRTPQRPSPHGRPPREAPRRPGRHSPRPFGSSRPQLATSSGGASRRAGRQRRTYRATRQRCPAASKVRFQAGWISRSIPVARRSTYGRQATDTPSKSDLHGDDFPRLVMWSESSLGPRVSVAGSREGGPPERTAVPSVRSPPRSGNRCCRTRRRGKFEFGLGHRGLESFQPASIVRLRNLDHELTPPGGHRPRAEIPYPISAGSGTRTIHTACRSAWDFISR